MILLSNPCTLADGLHCLGPYAVPLFLLDGDRPALFEGGVYDLGQYYVEEMRKILGSRSPSHLLLTHMHFDHCGATGYLKRRFPGAAIGQSPEGAEIIKKQSAIDLITKLNAQGREGKFFEPFIVDTILSDGDVLEVSKKASVRVLKTPGHTRDHLSYYIPEKKALIPSEAVGVPGDGEYIFSEFLIGYDCYMASLEKLASLDVEIIMLAHGACLTGSDARDYMPRAIEHTIRFRERIESLLEEHGDDHEAIVGIVKREEYDIIEHDKQPEMAYLINLRAKIRAVARDMRESSASPR